MTNNQVTLTVWQVISVNTGSQGNGLRKQFLPVLNIGCEHRKHSHGALAHRPLLHHTRNKKKKKKVNCSLFYCEALCKGLQLDMYNVMLLANEVKHIFGLVARDAQGQVCA